MAAPNSAQTIPSHSATSAPSTHPRIACGPFIFASRMGMVMNGPTPIISSMLAEVAPSRPMRRTRCGDFESDKAKCYHGSVLLRTGIRTALADGDSVRQCFSAIIPGTRRHACAREALQRIECDSTRCAGARGDPAAHCISPAEGGKCLGHGRPCGRGSRDLAGTLPRAIGPRTVGGDSDGGVSGRPVGRRAAACSPGRERPDCEGRNRRRPGEARQFRRGGKCLSGSGKARSWARSNTGSLSPWT